MKMQRLFTVGLISAASLQSLCAQQVWNKTSLNTNASWYAVAGSADGTKMVAGDAGPDAPGFGNGGQYGIWVSTNSGANWNQANAPTNASWGAFAVSADGTKMFAVDGGFESITNGTIYNTNYGIWISTNSGGSWKPSLAQTSIASNMIAWFSIACSADGSRLAAVGNAYSGIQNLSGVYTSTNSGGKWNQQTNAPVSLAWRSICSSADGNKLTAVFNYDARLGILSSTNSGVTWTPANAPTNDAWQTVVCTPDGVKLAADGNDTGLFWVSTNSGGSWTIETNQIYNLGGFSVATSANGNRLVAVGYDGIFTSTNGGLSWIQQTNEPGGFQWESVASSADGGAMVVANFGPGTNRGAVYISQGVVPPQLNVASAGGNLAISWIVPSQSYLLQQNTNLSTTNWPNLVGTPVFNLTNLQNQITVPESAANKAFYRLALP